MGITQYEQNQSFNWLVKWLHSFRYRHIIDVVRSIDNGLTIRVLDIGCAYGKLYEVLNEHFNIDYTGVDNNNAYLNSARERYGDKANFRVLQKSATDVSVFNRTYDVVAALETLEHIPEHDVVRIVENIRKVKPKRFVCSVPVEIGPIILVKNLGSALMGYARHKEYTWLQTLMASLYRLDNMPPHHVGHMGFDWHWLAQTIRHNFDIIETRRLPFHLPMCLSTSAFFVSRSRL